MYMILCYTIYMNTEDAQDSSVRKFRPLCKYYVELQVYLGNFITNFFYV